MDSLIPADRGAGVGALHGYYQVRLVASGEIYAVGFFEPDYRGRCGRVAVCFIAAHSMRRCVRVPAGTGASEGLLSKLCMEYLAAFESFSPLRDLSGLDTPYGTRNRPEYPQSIPIVLVEHGSNVSEYWCSGHYLCNP